MPGPSRGRRDANRFEGGGSLWEVPFLEDSFCCLSASRSSSKGNVCVCVCVCLCVHFLTAMAAVEVNGYGALHIWNLNSKYDPKYVAGFMGA